MNAWPPDMSGWMEQYLFMALQSLEGRHVAVQTVRGSVRGRIASVQPDHVVVYSGGAPFLIRIEQIVWVVPVPSGRKYLQNAEEPEQTDASG
jgi:hypothetical protein